MAWLIRGAIAAATGFLLGGPGLGALVRLLGGPGWPLETMITFGYPPALVGWLAGVGAWDFWARGWFGLPLRGDLLSSTPTPIPSEGCLARKTAFS